MTQAGIDRSAPAILCLGRFGDICVALPIAHELFYRTGKPVPWIVSQQYASLLSAASYVEPVIFEGAWDQVGLAMRKFRNRYQIVLAQAYARDHQIQAYRTESFVTDVWAQAQMLPRFGMPLVLDRVYPSCYEDPCEVHRPLKDKILVHTGGVSSPLPNGNALLAQLQQRFPVVDLATVNAVTPQEMLPLFQHARAAVLSDSFPLHLSFAVPSLPVIGLQQDQPRAWFGSPRRRNWIGAYRYQDVPANIDRIVEVMAGVKEAPPYGVVDFGRHGYNPSVIKWNGAMLFSYRFHGAGWRTLIDIACMLPDATSPVVKPLYFPDSVHCESFEDCRLFTHRGQLWASVVLSRMTDGVPRSIVVYGQLHENADYWDMSKPLHVKYGRNDWDHAEKNWVFFSHAGSIWAILPHKEGEPQVVLMLDGEDYSEWTSPAMTWAFGDVRGDSAPLPFKEGTLIRFFHSVQRYKSGMHRYHIGVCLIESRPPFTMQAITKAPLFSGVPDTASNDCPHYKPDVVFCCGAIQQGDNYLLSLGVNDCRSEIRVINKNMLGL